MHFKLDFTVLIIPCIENRNSVYFGPQGLLAKSLNYKNKSSDILCLDPTIQDSKEATFFTSASILTKKIIDSKINGDNVTVIANKTGCKLLTFVSQTLNPRDTELSTLSPSQKQNHIKNKTISNLQEGFKLIKRNSLSKILDNIAEKNPDLVKKYKRKSSGYSSDKKNIPSLTIPKKSICKIDFLYLLNYPKKSNEIDFFLDESSIKKACINLWSKDSNVSKYVGSDKFSQSRNIINLEVKVKQPSSNCLIGCFQRNEQAVISEGYLIELLGTWINFISRTLSEHKSSDATITFHTKKSKQPKIEWS